ncbi:MAG: sulfotransferase [Pseudomonadales bacterium]
MFIFLICTERSGSNFLTSLAGGFPDVSAPPPTHLFRLFANTRAQYGDLQREENWKTLVDDIVENHAAKLGTWHTSIDRTELLRKVTRRDAFELLRLIYHKEALADGASRSFVKENQTHTFAEALADFFPDSQFVMMVRDPRDVASSWVRTDSIPGGVQKAIDTWHRDQTEALPVFRKLDSAGRAHFLRYEDLIAEPQTHLKALARFMGIAYDDSVLEYYRDPRTRANAERIEAWQNTGRPIMRDNAGGYRRVLSDTDVRYIELRCARLMQRFGYPTESAIDTDAIDRAELARLEGQLTPGRYQIEDDREMEIRKRRLDAIHRVLARRLT